MSKKQSKGRVHRFQQRMERWMAKKLANIRANNPTRKAWLMSDIPPELTPEEAAFRERQTRRASRRAPLSEPTGPTTEDAP